MFVFAHFFPPLFDNAAQPITSNRLLNFE